MTLPSSGAITMAQVATELGVSQTGINLNQSNVRTLAGRPSGTISMSDLRGKANGGASLLVGSYNDGFAQYYGYGNTNFSAVGFGALTPNNNLTALPGMLIDGFFWMNMYGKYNIMVRVNGSIAANVAYDIIVAGVTYRGVSNTFGNTVDATVSLAQFNAMPRSGTIQVNLIKV